MADDMKITLDDAQVEGALKNIIANMSQLGTVSTDAGTKSAASMNELTAAAAKVGTTAKTSIGEVTTSLGTIPPAAERAGAGIHGAASELSGFALQAENASRAAGGLGTTMELLGLESAGGAQHIRLMNQAIRELAEAAGPMLLLVAAIEGISKAFEFFQEGVKDAAALQAQMDTLGSAVTAQGGHWQEAKEGVDQFIESETLASGFTSGQLVPALNQLVTAGNDVHDSQVILGVAEEMARSKHMELGEATQLLIDAEAGRTRGLGKLDLNLAAVIKSHGSMSDILKVLHHDMGGAITDSDNLEMASARLHVVQEQLGEAIGKLVLPMLTTMATTMIGLIKVGELMASGITDSFRSIVMAVQAAADAVAHFARAMGDVGSGNFSGAVTEFNAIGAAGTKFGAAQKLSDKGGKEMGAAMSADWTATGHKVINTAINEHNERLSDIHLDNNRHPGEKTKKEKKPKKAPAEGVEFNPVDAETTKKPEDIDALTKAHAALAAVLGDENAANKALKATVDASLDSKALDARLAQTQYEAYQKNITGIKDQEAAITKSRAAVIQARDDEQAAYATYQQSTKALSDLQKSLTGKTKLTAADKDALKEATDAQKQDEIAVGHADTALKKQTATLEAHEKKLKTDADAVNKYIAEQQKLATSINDEREKADQALADDITTHGKSEAEMVAYYAKRYADAKAAQEAFLAQHGFYDAALVKAENDTYNKLDEARKTEYNKEYDAEKKRQEELKKQLEAAQKEQEKIVATFLDDVLVKHKSFGDAFKAIWDTIVKNFIEQIAKMLIAGKSLGGLGGILGGLLGGGGAAGGSGASGGLGGLFSGLFGGGGSGGAASPLSAIPVAPVTAGTDFLRLTTGSATGVSAGAGFGGVLTGAVANGDDAVGGLIGLDGSGLGGSAALNAPGGASSNSLGNLLSSLKIGGHGFSIGNAMLGVGVGALLGGLQGGSHSINGEIGGAIGSLFGPIGSIAGGALGSLFGHKDNPVQMPDKYATGEYGQMLANLQPDGKSGDINGQSFGIDSGVSSVTGGKGELQYISDFITSGKTGLDANLSKEFAGATSVTGLQNGNNSLNNGQTMFWNQLENDANKAMQEITAVSASSTSSTIYQLTRMAPDFNTARMSAWGSIDSSGTTTKADTLGAPRSIQPIQVTVNVPGGVVGTTPAQLAQLVQQQIQRNSYYGVGNNHLAL